jgi:hypothetical protein
MPIQYNCRGLESLVSAGQGCQLETQGRLTINSKGHLLAEIPFFLGEVSFLLKPSTDWMKPTHMMEGNWLSSKSANFNIKII